MRSAALPRFPFSAFRLPAACLAMLAFLCTSQTATAARYDGELTIRAIDQQTQQPIPVRMELRNAKGRPVKVRAEGITSRDGYFVFDGQVTLPLRKGQYTFLIEAGPEYQTRPGHFTIERNAEDTTEVVLRRRVDMQAEGWWAGDLDVRQRPEDLPLLMRAAGLNLTPMFSQANIRGKCDQDKKRKQLATPLSGEILIGSLCSLDYRQGGGLLYLQPDTAKKAFDVCQWKADDSSLTSLQAVKSADGTAIALTPFAWDLPIWIAQGKLDAIQVIHRHALVNNVVDNEGWGRKRNKTFFPGKTGNGRWSEHIYHHLLNCGLQITPAAGSGSGFNKNPIGTNRTYVHCGEEFSTENWFAGLRAGKVMVTNGPLLRTQVEGQPPGHQFQLDKGESHDFQIALGLAFYEKSPVEYLEIVKNGFVVHNIRLNELAKERGKLPALNFDDSGWFLVRAMTSTTKNYQYATTGPYYVQANYQPRISRSSVQFFLDWLDDATQEFADHPATLSDIEAARPFWEELLSNANAD